MIPMVTCYFEAQATALHFERVLHVPHLHGDLELS